jgi:alpha-beta hydrolase superfamily lysophospholipase
MTNTFIAARRIPRWRTAAARSFARAAGMLALLACSLAQAGSFYDATPAQAAGAPGTLIRSEPMPGAPFGASALRILYRSVGVHGEAIAVSGVVLIPPWSAPAGGRPVVAWAHPTSGVVPRCAPSLALGVFRSIQGLQQMLARGYVVVATDYPGLGTPGPHPYLVGDSEARAVLDSVRAVRAIAAAQASARFAVWGHSQGGQAALFSGILAKTYAPELHLVGVAAAAPATDLETLLRDDFPTDGGRNLTAMTLWSWTRVYGLPIDHLVEPRAMPAVDALAGECIESAFDMAMRMVSQRGLQHGFLTVPDITRVEPWQSMLRADIPGPLPAGLPLFVAQGEADTLVRPAVTRAYVAQQCTAGGAVRLLMMPGVNHGFAGGDSAGAAVDWIGDRFAGRPPPSDCPAADGA